jgi:hypothetical protein
MSICCADAAASITDVVQTTWQPTSLAAQVQAPAAQPQADHRGACQARRQPAPWQAQQAQQGQQGLYRLSGCTPSGVKVALPSNFYHDQMQPQGITKLKVGH